jgi:hypothetical protein
MGDSVVVQGSRAAGTAKAGSDIDFALMLNDYQFTDALNAAFLKSTGRFPSVNTAAGRTLLTSVVEGRIFRNPAGLRPLSREIERILNMEVDFSAVRKGGSFDTQPQIPLLDCNK